MSAGKTGDQIAPLVVPQVNVNDESVIVARWIVADGTAVQPGDAVCDVETTKAASELTAPCGGVLVHAVAVGARVAVGATVGVIAPTRDAAKSYLGDRTGPTQRAQGSGATPKAAALAAQHGVDLNAVRARGVRGTIKESDVRTFLAEAARPLPAGLDKYVEHVGPLPAFDAAVAANLRRSTQHLILTTVDMDCRLTAAHAVIREAHAAGRMVSVLHLVLAAAGRVLPDFARLTSFVWDQSLYRHTAVDIAFVVRASDGRLFTPVIRGIDRLSVAEISTASQGLAMRAMRGLARAEDFEGAAFTISQVPVPGTKRVVALPSFGQSAILGMSAERSLISVDDGVATAQPGVTLTLAYDHALCDGVYAANFLAALVTQLETGVR